MVELDDHEQTANRLLRRLTEMAALKREEKIAKSLRERSLYELQQQQLTTLDALSLKITV